jgi:hypothetical protein
MRFTTKSLTSRSRRTHTLGHLAGEQLGHRRFLQARPAHVLQCRGVMNQLAGSLDARGLVGEIDCQRYVVQAGAAPLGGHGHTVAAEFSQATTKSALGN